MRFMRTPSNILFPIGLVLLMACGGQERASAEAEGEAEASAETAAAGESERYRVVAVPEGLSWEEAKERAEADGGHLVTIGSAEENELVHSLIAENADLWVTVEVTDVSEGEERPIQATLGPWIGLYQPPGSPEPDGGWTWVTGEALDYSNWWTLEGPEPNDMAGIEHFGHFFGGGLDNRASSWNDMANDAPVDFAEAGLEFVGDVYNPRAYIVEFEQ